MQEDDENLVISRKKNLDRISIILIVIMVCGLLFYVGDLYLRTSEGFSCVVDPFLYGAQKTAELNSASLYCSCSLTSTEAQGPVQKLYEPIVFTDRGYVDQEKNNNHLLGVE